MADNQEEAAGLAIAAFTLAQMTFWHLLQEGLLDKAGAERILQRATEANAKGGPDHKIAAAKLANVLGTLQAYRPVVRNGEGEADVVYRS